MTLHVAVLGGGPAGCGAAYQVPRRGRGRVTLIERSSRLGGNAGSFELEGVWCDYGSHRLHHACDPGVLADLERLLGPDLRDRPRRGRIRLGGRWLGFPIRAADLALHLDRRFALGAALDALTRPLRRAPADGSFEQVLRANLGSTFAERFYLPYARKIWGRDPDQLSGAQASKRVTAGDPKKLLGRLLRPPGGGCFYYPRRGYGQISEAYAEAGQALGSTVHLETRATRVRRAEAGWIVDCEGPDGQSSVHADQLWSTIPSPVLLSMMEPAPPAAVSQAAGRLRFRAMVLVYLVLPVDRLTPTDAHYFPEAQVRMTRLSEPKNYFGERTPVGRTVLCAELPCDVGDATWTATPEVLARQVLADMRRVELPTPAPTRVEVRRLPQAYPIYDRGYEDALAVADAWLGRQPDLLVYGRQGLFAHDNTHHALAMAYAAADCLSASGFDAMRWAAYRRIFEGHVVED